MVLHFVLRTSFIPDSGAKVVCLGFLPNGLFLFLPWDFPIYHGKIPLSPFMTAIFVPATSPSSSWHPVGVFDAFSSAKVACPDDPASTVRLFQKKSLGSLPLLVVQTPFGHLHGQKRYSMSFLQKFLALVIFLGHAFTGTEKVYTRQVMPMKKKAPSQEMDFRKSLPLKEIR